MLGSCVFCAPLDRHIDQHINQHSAVISMCRSTYTYRSDVSWCQPTLDPYVGQYGNREWLSDCRLTCWSIDYWHSTDTYIALLNFKCSNPSHRQGIVTMLSFILLIPFPVNRILCIWQYFPWVSCWQSKILTYIIRQSTDIPPTVYHYSADNQWSTYRASVGRYIDQDICQ